MMAAMLLFQVGAKRSRETQNVLDNCSFSHTYLYLITFLYVSTTSQTMLLLWPQDALSRGGVCNWHQRGPVLSETV